jgi:hypothetical protein
MSKHVVCSLVASTLFAAASAAQSFNIDVRHDPSPPPPASYGGFPGKPGVWNNILPLATPQVLSRLDGTIDNSTISFATDPATAVQGGIPAPETPLYEDFAIADFTTTVTNLAAGQYVLVLYSWYPGSSTTFTVTDGTGTPQTKTVNSNLGMFPGFVELGSMVRFTVAMSTTNATLTIQVSTAGGEGGVLNGLQLVHFVPNGGACPQPANSLGQFPSVSASGTFNPSTNAFSIAANNLVLHAGLLPPPGGQLSNPVGAILCFASNDNLANQVEVCPVAEGKRCIGLNNLTRVLDPNAPAGSGGVGTTTVNGTYAVPVDLVAMAAQGLTVAPGVTLHFQMCYRDTAVLCTGAQTVRRWTETISILLEP